MPPPTQGALQPLPSSSVHGLLLSGLACSPVLLSHPSLSPPPLAAQRSHVSAGATVVIYVRVHVRQCSTCIPNKL